MTIKAIHKIEQLLENMTASPGPAIPFGGGALSIKSSYAKPVLQGKTCTQQDKGAESKCQK